MIYLISLNQDNLAFMKENFSLMQMHFRFFWQWYLFRVNAYSREENICLHLSLQCALPASWKHRGVHGQVGLLLTMTSCSLGKTQVWIIFYLSVIAAPLGSVSILERQASVAGSQGFHQICRTSVVSLAWGRF
jgi:hypothetical protein